jgi:hypothetical protein
MVTETTIIICFDSDYDPTTKFSGFKMKSTPWDKINNNNNKRQILYDAKLMLKFAQSTGVKHPNV